jgi:hypothetical protein
MIITTVLFATNLYANQLPDSDWMAYFGAEDTVPREFKLSILTPFGPQEFTQRVKPKGSTAIEGREYRKSMVLHDSGLLANRIKEVFVRVANDGLFEWQEGGNEILLRGH